MPVGWYRMVAESSTSGLPPALRSIEAEQSVLGGLLIDGDAWPRIATRVVAGDFSRPDHRVIFNSLSELAVAGQPLDLVTVSAHLERLGAAEQAGGLAYLATLAANTAGSANIETYADVVADRALHRRLRATLQEALRTQADGDGRAAAEVVASLQLELQQLHSSVQREGGLVEMSKLLGGLLDDLDRRAHAPTGLLIGLPDFDELSCGLEGGDLVVIAARPGMGKTALLVSVAAAVSERANVAVFSAEMPAQQLMRRALALQSGISQGRLRRSQQLDGDAWRAISDAAQPLGARKLWVDDAGAPTLSHVRAETLALHARSPLALVLIDYAQLLRGTGANRYEQLRDVAYGLKALAKELATPIMALAQLNRGVEQRTDRRPYLSDLRDSGAIEEAADIVGLLYSEGYYDSNFSMPYVLECSIAKNRNGERGECLWHFQGEHSRVSQLAEGARAQYLRQRGQGRSRSPDADL